MKFVKVRYNGKSTYKDRTTLRTVWQPGDTNLVSEADARMLLGYLEFERVTDGASESELTVARHAQAHARAQEDKHKKLTEAELMEIEQMDKAALEAYARANYGVDLDKRKSVDTLRVQVTALVQDGVK